MPTRFTESTWDQIIPDQWDMISNWSVKLPDACGRNRSDLILASVQCIKTMSNAYRITGLSMVMTAYPNVLNSAGKLILCSQPGTLAQDQCGSGSSLGSIGHRVLVFHLRTLPVCHLCSVASQCQTNLKLNRVFFQVHSLGGGFTRW